MTQPDLYNACRNMAKLTTYFVNGTPLTGHPWVEPLFHNVEYDDTEGAEFLFEWWNNEHNRKLSIYVDYERIEALYMNTGTKACDIYKM